MGHWVRATTVALALLEWTLDIEIHISGPADLVERTRNLGLTTISMQELQESTPHALVVDGLTVPVQVVLNPACAFSVALSPFISCGEANALPMFDLQFHRSPWPSGLPHARSLRDGSRWAVIRGGLTRAALQPPRFKGLPVIGVSLGGGTTDEILGIVLAELARLDDPPRVLIPRDERHSLPSVREFQIAGLRVSAPRVEEIWTELRNCSAVITQAGITPFEAAYVGTPPLILSRGALDDMRVRELCECGAAEVFPLSRLASVVRDLRGSNGERLIAMAAQGRRLIDDQGATRIAREIWTTIARR